MSKLWICESATLNVTWIWPTGMVLVHDTLSCHGKHLCQVISKSPYAWPCFSLDTRCWCLILTNDLKCDLDLWPTGMVLVCVTPSSHGKHVCQVISKYPNAWPNNSLDMKCWRLILTNNLKCDLDLWPTDMVLVRITPSCHGEHLCQVISKYLNAWPSYSLDEKCSRLIMNNNLKCDLILTYRHGSCTRHIVLPWWTFVPSYFKIPLFWFFQNSM